MLFRVLLLRICSLLARLRRFRKLNRMKVRTGTSLGHAPKQLAPPEHVEAFSIWVAARCCEKFTRSFTNDSPPSLPTQIHIDSTTLWIYKKQSQPLAHTKVFELRIVDRNVSVVKTFKTYMVSCGQNLQIGTHVRLATHSCAKGVAMVWTVLHISKTHGLQRDWEKQQQKHVLRFCPGTFASATILAVWSSPVSSTVCCTSLVAGHVDETRKPPHDVLPHSFCIRSAISAWAQNVC